MNTKEEIRKIVKIKRQRMSEKEWEEKSLIIQKKFLEEFEWKNYSTFLCYVHFDKEVKTDTVIKTLLSKEKIICVPKVIWRKNLFIPVRIFSFSDIDFNIKIPQPKTENTFEPEKIELSITPGVAFDIYGNRIGMGGGYYDRFFNQNSNIFKISFAFDFQIFDFEIPVKPHDRKMDVIITEKRIIEIKKIGKC